MKLEMMFIGALLFGLVFVAGLNIYGEALSNYNVDVDTSNTFGKMSNNLQSIYDYQKNMKEDIQGGSVTDENAVDDMVSGGYKAIRTNPVSALTVATNASMVFAQETGVVDEYFVAFFVTVLAILVIFAIIAIIFKFEIR